MRVFSNGCLDVLSPAHFNLLAHCRKLAGEDGKVIIALDSDEKITKDKGISRPIFSYKERCEALSALGVDIVVQFSTNEELHEWIEYFKPDILVKDSNWRGNVIGSDICKVEYMNRDLRFSTTKIIEKVLSKHFDIMESFYGNEDSNRR